MVSSLYRRNIGRIDYICSFKPYFRWSAPYTTTQEGTEHARRLGKVLNLILDGQLLIPLFFNFIRIKGVFNLKI